LEINLLQHSLTLLEPLGFGDFRKKNSSQNQSAPNVALVKKSTSSKRIK